jgi:hypothetical protein
MKLAQKNLLKLDSLPATYFKNQIERNHYIVEKRLKGFTLEEIGKSIGVTRERVRQINAKMKGPTQSEVESIRFEKYKFQIIEILRINPNLDRTLLALELGISGTTLKKYLGHSIVKVANAQGKSSQRIYSNQDLLNTLKLAPKNSDGTLSAGKFIKDGGTPTIAVFLTRFGSWNNACKAAGIPTTQGRKDYVRRNTDEELLQYVASFLEDPRENGTAAGYEKWQKLNKDAPSLSLIRQRLGKWNELKKKLISNL